MEDISQFLDTEHLVGVYEPTDIIINLTVAFALGMIISAVYKQTHKGLSYSQSYMLTIIFISIITAMVIMVIGNSLARAFALVGALSIIRFRTVVKDTKDTAYIFLALATGMAAGTSSYFLALTGVAFIMSVAVMLYFTNYGSLYKSEFILRFRAPVNGDETPPYSAVINQYTKSGNLLHVEPSGDGLTTKLTFDILMKPDTDPNIFSAEIAKQQDVTEVILVASRTDVDY